MHNPPPTDPHDPNPKDRGHPPDARRVRAQLFAILHAPDPGNRLARWANYFLAALILANAVTITVESLPGLDANWMEALRTFEAASTALFVIEYVARMWTCVEQRRLAQPLLGRLRWALQPLSLLDLVAIATYWTPWDMRFLRVVRLIRLLRILQLYELHAALDRLAVSLSRRKQLLIVAVALMVMFVYVGSALLYEIEHARQPQVFSSIPATFWWACVTFNTIGYGDMVPLTPLGKTVASLISVFGIGTFALPTAIVIAAIIESSSPGIPYVCEECGHRGTTAHHHHHDAH